MEILEHSCKKNNIKYVIIKPYLKKKYEYIDKFYYIKEFINKLDDNEVIITMDAYDTFVVGNHDEILNKYLNSNKKFLVGTHHNCNNYLSTIIYNIAFGNDIMSKNLLNAGMWISKVLYAKEVTNLCLDLKITDDQIALIKIMKTRPDLIQLDNEKLLFANFQLCNYFYPTEIYLERNGFVYDNRLNRIKNIDNGNYPCFIHGPVNMKLCDLVNKIYPEVKNCKDIKLYDYIMKRLKNRLLIKYTIYALLIIILIVLIIKFFTIKKSGKVKKFIFL
jgi:hypothetical protein